MLLSGTIEINGLTLTATVEVTPIVKKRKGVSFCPNIGDCGKWRAYQTVNGRNKHLGYYETEADALEAARQKRNLAPVQRDKTDREGVHMVQRGATILWRATYLPATGRRLRLGEYATKGAAILVRDVVARRCGGTVMVSEYEMPLAFVSNAVARSFIRDPIGPAAAADVIEFERRVSELSGMERRDPVTSPVLSLPAELWRQKQPSRVGRSPFDTLDP